MTGRPHYLGLCSTCAHAPECVYRIYGGQPVWHCNEFDDAEGEEPKERPGPPSIARDDTHQATQDTPELTGLCGNCEERTYCRLPKPASGVWFCEEYR